MSTLNVNLQAGLNPAGGEPEKGNNGLKLTVKANLNLGSGNDAIHQLNGKIGGNQGQPITISGDLQVGGDGHHNKPAGPENPGNQGETQKGNQTQGQNPPIIQPQNPNGKGSRGQQNPTVNNPPLINIPNPTGKGNTNNPTNNNPPIIQYPTNPRSNHYPNNNPQYPTNNPQTPTWKPTIIIFTTRTYNPSVPNGTLRNAVIDILRRNDIFISRSVINNLIGNNNSNGNQTPNIPSEVRNLVQNLVNQLTNKVNNTTQPTNQFVRDFANNLSNNLQSQISMVRDVLAFTNQPEIRNFTNLNIQERVHLAVELMFNHLPSDTKLNQLPNQDIYNGLLLARGLVSSNENTADVRNLVGLKNDILPMNFSVTGLRDLGQLVKVLVTDAAGAKSTANLDLAVQKFIRILLANNELGILLAAAALAKQGELGTLSMNRTLALVQIYQLITRLVQAGEAALKEAAAKSVLNKNEFVGANLSKSSNDDEKNMTLRDLQTNNLHGSLKTFLEFNPAFVAERSASSFINSEDARQAQQHFSSHHADEIESWLNSGNHRFVKEINLDKPIGIVVERGVEDYFSATRARIVLVRDSSPQGWHFLKSFLVK